jgi:hypothetical protein
LLVEDFYPGDIAGDIFIRVLFALPTGAAMTYPTPPISYTSFQGHRRLASGPLHVVALAAKLAIERDNTKPNLIFDDSTGRAIDIDTRGSDDDVLARYAPAPAGEESEPEAASEVPRGRGRPKLGVVAREVTLLPRHWEWLAGQPGGPSVVLRKLVEEARRTHAERDKARANQERAYQFMLAMAGDMPGFEEATRALFANDAAKFAELITAWPADVRAHATRLAFEP